MRIRLPSLSTRGSEAITAYLFLLPAALVLGLFGLFPLVFNAYISLFDWRIKHASFVGLANYGEIFGGATPFFLLLASIALISAGFALIRRRRKALSRVARRVASRRRSGRPRPRPAPNRPDGRFRHAAFLPSDGLVLAGDGSGATPPRISHRRALDGKFKGKQAFRVIYLVPYIVPTVATAAVFERLFSLRPESWANQVLALFGARPLQWLREYKGVFEMLFGPGLASGSGSLARYWIDLGRRSQPRPAQHHDL